MTLLELVENKPGYKKQSANTWEGPCPKCGGTKRFVIWTQKDIFKCRDCDFKGDLIKYLREVEGYTCREAFLAMGRECLATDCPSYEKCKGNTAPRRRSHVASAAAPVPKGDDWQPREAKNPAAAWVQKGTEFVEWSHEQLLASPEQLRYLESRGLPLSAVQKYRLGFNPGAVSKGEPGPLFKNREAWGLEKKRNDENTRWITVFPIQRGIIIPSFRGEDLYRIRIRRLDEDLAQYPEGKKPAKYLFLDGSGKGLVIRNLDAKAFLVVESDLCDLLVDHLAADLICAVPLTSCGIRPDSATAPIFSKAVCILNALDFDPRINPETGKHESPGGQNARWWQKHFPRSERWPVPVGKDPGDAFQAGANLREWIISGLPISLQPRQGGKASIAKDTEKQEVVVEFDHDRAWQRINDARSSIASGFSVGAMEWLQEQPKILGYLKSAEAAVDQAFLAANEDKLIQVLEKWVEAHKRAWEIYESRPPIIDTDQ